jgi:hypothetical protein
MSQSTGLEIEEAGGFLKMTVRRRTTRGLFITVAVILLSWGVFHAKVFASNVTASWSYDYGPEPACSTTQITSCIDHFEVEDITNQQSFVLIQTVPNPPTVIGKVDHISTSFKYGPSFGKRTISVIAVGKDPKGQRVTSNPFAARITVTIRPGVKTSLAF